MTSQEEFDLSFDIFSGGLLRGLDWTGLVAAGGAILACALKPKVSTMPSEEEDMRDQLGEWFDPTVHKLHRRGASAHYRAYSAGVKGQKPRSPFASSSDIDLFLVDPEDATGDASQGASNKAMAQKFGARRQPEGAATK